MTFGCRQGFISVSRGKFVSAVAVPVQSRPRLEEREVREGLEVLEVVNSYLSIPVTSFAVSRMEQVDRVFFDKNLELIAFWLRLTSILMRNQVAVSRHQSRNQTVLRGR